MGDSSRAATRAAAAGARLSVGVCRRPGRGGRHHRDRDGDRAGGGDESTTPAPGRTTTGNTARETPQETEGGGERADLAGFEPDNRSAAGGTGIWVVWTIRNGSGEESGYSWDGEAVDADGTRLENGTQLETDVRPGQTARGEYPTTLRSTKGVELNVTGFDRAVSH
ncbi:hypothetical protein ACIQ1J_28405 [Streptomyces sp. NPDC097107]|uniref:hypothetical protein n=1 Tax=Streptomyces sp. NPDC097107 TaxID=3366089 RepID=UPI003820EFC4